MLLHLEYLGLESNDIIPAAVIPGKDDEPKSSAVAHEGADAPSEQK